MFESYIQIHAIYKIIRYFDFLFPKMVLSFLLYALIILIDVGQFNETWHYTLIIYL